MATGKPYSIRPYINRTTGTESYRVSGSWRGERLRKNFSNFAEAEAFCNEKNQQACAQGPASAARVTRTRLSDADIAAAEAVMDKAQGRWTLAQMLDAGIKSLENAPKSEKLSKLVAEWHVVVKREVGARWYKQIKNVTEAFVRDRPEVTTATFNRTVVREWLDASKQTAQTMRNKRNVLHRFGGWLVQKNHYEFNPVSGIFIGRSKEEKSGRALPSVFTPRQAEAWMRACSSPECRRLKGWATLCLFAGLRPNSEAIRLTWSEINMKTGEVAVMGTKRGAKPRMFVMQPAALTWLKEVKEDQEATPGFYMRHLHRRAVHLANLWLAEKWPEEKPIAWDEDIQRHTYASYRSSGGIAVDKLAGEMGTSTRTIYAHYRHPRSKAEVKAFWGIRP